MASYLSEAARMTASAALVSPILLLKSVAPFPAATERRPKGGISPEIPYERPLVGLLFR
jgi:hypothetical protein